MTKRLLRYFSADALLGQFLKYVIVGGIAFLADYGSLYALTEFAGFHYLLSATIAFLLGLTVNYLLSVCWVFTERKIERRLLEFTIFAVIGIVGLLLNNLIMYLFTDIVRLNYLISKIIAAVLVLLWNFGARKMILFNKKKKCE